MNEVIKVFVGADRSQALAIKVLEHSIKRHSNAKVEVIPMIDLPTPEPKDPRNSKRTGFSFSRFCIPALAGYSGKAIYMDADMLVFKDIQSLWNIDLENGTVAIQSSVENANLTLEKENAPTKRIKQCAVMLIDCEKAKWDIKQIIHELDGGKYNYEELMYHLCILPEDEVKYKVPGHWNSLEYFDENTSLLHYTDMGTQPWVSPLNKLGDLWFNEVRLMLQNNQITIEEIKNEITNGYFRPSLITEIKYGQAVPSWLKSIFNRFNQILDTMKGYKAHKKVYEQKKIRDKAIKKFLLENNA